MKLILKNFLLDMFFPKKCVSCGKTDTFLCDKCFGKIVFIKSPTCPACGKLSKKGKYCARCRPKTDLTGIIIAAHFEEGPIKELIHSFKYDGLTDLKNLLSFFFGGCSQTK